jgi:large subunit ribosomal protein L10
VKKEDKEQVVAELTGRLQKADTLLVADYRGLTMPQIDTLRSRLLESGAQFHVVKNTLTRRAAEAAGADALLALLEGPSAIAFIEADGDMVAAAKAFADSARDTRILVIRGGVMSGRTMTAAEVESLATLPPLEVLRGQVLGAVLGPLNAIAGLVNAPLQNLYGLIDARIEQLEEQGDTSASAAPAAEEAPVAEEAPGAEEEAETGAAPAVSEETPEEADASTPADATASASDTTTQTTED